MRDKGSWHPVQPSCIVAHWIRDRADPAQTSPNKEASQSPAAAASHAPARRRHQSYLGALNREGGLQFPAHPPESGGASGSKGPSHVCAPAPQACRGLSAQNSTVLEAHGRPRASPHIRSPLCPPPPLPPHPSASRASWPPAGVGAELNAGTDPGQEGLFQAWGPPGLGPPHGNRPAPPQMQGVRAEVISGSRPQQPSEACGPYWPVTANRGRRGVAACGQRSHSSVAARAHQSGRAPARQHRAPAPML